MVHRFPRSVRATAFALGLLAAAALNPAQVRAGSVGTAISYQGRLNDGGAPADGVYDFEFRLFASEAGAGQTGSAVEVGDVAVADGLFSVALDFGPGVFDGNELYLQIAVRPGASSGAYTPLAGRVRLNGVPFAQHALHAQHAAEADAADTALTAGAAENADMLDGLDSSAFAPAEHEHSVLASPSGNHPSVVATDDSHNTTFAGPLVFASGERLDNQEDQVLRLSNDEEPGEIQMRVDQAGGTSIRGGTGQGESFVVGALDSTLSGADGDGLVLRAGDARPGAMAAGGTVTIAPGEGADGGGDGQIFLNGYTSVGNTFEVGDMILKGTLADFDGFTGTGGQVLTSTGGGGVVWSDLDVDANLLDGIDSTGFATAAHTHSSLAAPDGSPAQAVSADIDGNLVLATGTIRRAGGGEFELGSSFAFLRNTTSGAFIAQVASNDLLIYGGPASLTGKMVIEPFRGEIDQKGYTMEVRGGNASFSGDGDGGDLLLKGGGGGAGDFAVAGGHGGDVTIEGGDATLGPKNGGDVTIKAGLPFLTGNSGKVTISTPQPPGSTDAGDIEILGGSGTDSGSGTGGDILIRGGKGAGATSGAGGRGGDITIQAGDADNSDGTAHRGGNIVLDPGTQINGGGNGIVQSVGSLAVRRTTASHPIHVGTSGSNGNGAHVTNGGVWTNGSDANSKTAFEEIDPQAILAKVLALPVTRWQYQGEPEGVRHIGPMAQDFMAAFGLGESERHIGTVDADGVALAAIKGLDAKSQARFAVLERENALLVERNKVLEERLSRLEQSMRLISGQGNETQ